MGSERKEEDEMNVLLLGAVAFVFIACIVTFIFGNTSEHNARGTFGDMFGAVNAVFSGLAFCGVVYAILLQRADIKLTRADLKLTRADLKLTRDELVGQKIALEDQANALSKQSFENSFFSRIENLRSVIAEISIAIPSRANTAAPVILSGSGVFAKRKADLDHELYSCPPATPAVNRLFFRDHIRVSFDSELRLYVSGLEDLFAFVESSEIENRKQYFSTIAAQMSKSQKTFLYLYCISEKTPDDPPSFLNQIICKYGLLKGLSFEDDDNRYTQVKYFIHESAFQ